MPKSLTELAKEKLAENPTLRPPERTPEDIAKEEETKRRKAERKQARKTEEKAKLAKEESLKNEPPIDIPKHEPIEPTVDAVRGLYWLITRSSAYKYLKKAELKQKLDELMATKEGMRRFYRALEDIVFS